jgi:hypothetical protein
MSVAPDDADQERYLALAAREKIEVDLVAPLMALLLCVTQRLSVRTDLDL